MQSITVHRETLYTEAWKEPISIIAKRYNVSDVALAKVCRKLKVPVPPRGYWAKIRSGHQLNKPKLPKLPSGTPEVARISPNLDRSRTIPDAVREQLSFEAVPENRISEAQFNRRLHPLVNTTKKILEGKMGPGDRQPCLDIRVSIGTRDRALRLLSALFYAIEERGFGVKVTPREKEGSVVIIKREQVRFSLEERSKRVTVSPSMKASLYSSKFKFEPTGKLTFRIHDYWTEGLQKSWSDGARHSLEDQLNDIIPVLVDISLIAREKRLERDKKWALREEQERLRALDEARGSQLKADLQNWLAATQLREFIARIRDHRISDESQPELLRWVEWANRVANRLDPLGEGLGDFLKRYKF
jgi:DNA-binding transcriptional regulator YhcF (GntR family)